MFVKLLSVKTFWKKGPGFLAVPRSTNDLLLRPEKVVRTGPRSLSPDLQSCQLENGKECIYGALRDQNETKLFLSLAAALYFSLFDDELYFQKNLLFIRVSLLGQVADTMSPHILVSSCLLEPVYSRSLGV